MTRFAATALLLVSSLSFADPIADGVAYLLAQRAPDGSFGNGTGEQRVLATVEALETLRAVGQGDTLPAHYAELYLAISPRVPDAEVELRREMALATTGQAIPIKARLGHAAGFEQADPLHLALTLQADITAGRAATTASFLVMLDLKTRIQASGCWRWADNDDSVQLTAQSVRSLRALLDVPTPGLPSNGHINFGLQEGARCLRNASGSYGSLGATAMALEALLVAPGANATQIQAARTALLLAQASDGSIAGSVRVTAIAVRGLIAGAPDWRIVPDDFNRPVLALQDRAPLAGVDAVARLDVENRSGSPAPATTVRFLLKPLGGGPELFGAEVPLQAMTPGQLLSVVAQIPTTTLQGQYTVRAVVDPSGAVAEISENNNEASANLNVRAEADLAITASSIRFVAAGVGQVQVDVTVRNLGVPLTQNVSVGVWKGNPLTGGVRLGGATVTAGLATNAAATVSVVWAAASANGPTVITAVADEFKVLPEADESNNSAFRYYFPGAANPVDLSVDQAEASFSPAVVRPGDTVTITALVRNLSGFDVSRVPITVTNGAAPLVLAQTELPFIAANGSQLVSVVIPGLRASIIARVTVDPFLTLNDTNRGNNSIFGLSISPTASPDAELSIANLSEGTTTLVAQVQNFGTKRAATSVTLTDLTHNTVVAVVPVTLLAPDISMLAIALPKPPQSYAPAVLRACLDEENLFPEPDESNNCADISLSGTQTVDLKVHPRDLAFSPVGADIGEKVHVSAVIHNLPAGGAGRDATAVVEWWQGAPGTAGARLAGSSAVAVAANGTTTAQFEWVRAAGPVEFCARITQILPRDTNTPNTLSCRHLFLEQVIDTGRSFVFQTGTDVRVARLTGQSNPELVLAYSQLFDLQGGGPGVEHGIAMLQKNAAGAYVERWHYATPKSLTSPNQEFASDLVIADLDNDGAPEVVLLTELAPFDGFTVRKNTVTAIRADGTVKWATSYFPSANREGKLALGDVNGDGIADLVTNEERIRVFSGDDGHLVWNVPHPVSSATSGGTAVVLDVDGNGTNEVFVNNSNLFLLSSTGAQLWTSLYVTNTSHTGLAIIDVDLDGIPEAALTRQNDTLTLLDLSTGLVKARGTEFGLSHGSAPAAGPALQDGLPYAFLSNNGVGITTYGFNPDLSVLWKQPVDSFVDNPYAGLLVDLYGRGRPQFVANGGHSPLATQDSRDGALILPASPSIAESYDTSRSPAAADLGSGKATVLVMRRGSNADTFSGGPPHYGRGELMLFSSPHWVRQPALWPTRVLRKGQVDETTLRVSTDYRWWTSHNTWNQQFDVEPARLLPDLLVTVAASPSPGTAGTTTTLSATVKNVGGLNASNVAVEFFDGDPASGGKSLGTATVSGPVVIRGGTGVASLPWIAYPEGEHFIYAVANPAGAIEESDRENNTGFTRYFVEPGTNLCDSTVDASSLAAAPTLPLAGQAVHLSATVRNAGPLQCPAHLLTVRDGAAGPVLGVATVPALAPGAQASVAVQTIATPGTHLVRFIGDEAAALQDGNTDNNVATLVLSVPAATQPDYLVASLTFGPNPAREGELVTGEAVVRNQGAATSAATSLGLSLGLAVTVDGIGAGQSQAVAFTFVAPASSLTVEARADANAALVEFNEANNALSAQLAVEPSGLSLAGVASPSTALPGTAVGVTVTAQLAPPNARELFFDAQLLNGSGAVVANVATARREVLAPGTSSVGFSFNTGSLAPGAYVLRVSGRSGGRLDAVTDIALTVLPETSALTALSLDRATYRPGEEAVLTQRTTNLSRNAPLAGATLVVRVLSPSAAVLSSTTRQLATLTSGAFVDTVDLFAISPSLPPGTYSADSTVRDSNGLILGLTSATFTVAYQPQETVRGALSAVSPFPIGPALNATIQLTNDGALALSNGTLELSLVNATSLAVESFATAPVSVAAGGAASVSVAVATSGISEGQKLLVARLGGRTLDRLLLLAIRNVDVDPPVILVSGVVDGEFANHDVAPVVTVQDQSSFTTSFQLDGLPFTNGDLAASEGAHMLSLSATDASGNSSQLVIHFTIDRTMPVLTLTGPAHGALLVGPVTLSFSATDANLGAVTSTLDSSSFANGGTVSADGVHVWTVTAVDAAGNTTSQSRTFVLDATPPVLSISGVSDGDLLNHPVTVTFSATDAHPGTASATLDGAPFSSGSSVPSEGAHVLHVTAVDALGNTSTRTLSFTLDLTAPAISIAGVASGAVRNAPVTLTYSATGASSVSATLDGLPFTSGDTVSSAGDHLLVVTAADLAGNSATQSVPFALDFVAPVISVSGVSSGELRNAPVTIGFSAADLHPGSVGATLDGAPFASGGVVSAPGDHQLYVTATDTAGNVATRSVPFSIDVAAPVITITGITDGALQNTPATISFSASDAHPGTVFATLDGAPFSSGSTVSSAGNHTLVVTASDAAGNTASRSLVFTLDFTPPVIVVTGVSSGALRNTPVTITFAGNEAHPGTTTSTLDGVAFSSGGTVSAAGDHLLVVTSTDAAGNSATRSVPFSLDFTPPVIQLSGVSEGASGTAFTPVFSATDAHAVTVSATLDGAAFVSGATVTAAGAHTLVVTAIDGAGNVASQTVHFTVTGVSTGRPTFHFAVCAFGGLTVQNNALVQGGPVATNAAFVMKNNARIEGAVVSGGNASLSNNALVDGRVWHGGSFSQSNNALASGGHQSVSPAPSPCECGFDVTAALAAAAASNDNALLVGNPSFVNGVLTVQSNATLTLQAGRYSLTSLEVKNNAMLTAAPGAQVELFVQGSVLVRNNATLGGPVGSAPMLVVSGATAANQVDIKNNADATLLLYAPAAPVSLSNNAKIYGAVVGKDITLSNNQGVVLTGVAASTPPPLTCPGGAP